MGRVQGVGFRYFTRRRARSLGLQGWVRNERDGSVSLEAEGPREDLRVLLDAIRLGPPSSYVERVISDWSAATGEWEAFVVRY